MVALVEHIDRNIGPIEAMVLNIGRNSPNSILTNTAQRHTKIWEMCCLAGFLTGREVAKRMVARVKTVDEFPQGPPLKGTIIFTGASAFLRGSANFAGFADGKMTLRSLAQSMARKIGPMGIHVEHTIIDGAIDTHFIRSQFPERYAMRDQGGILDPEHITDAYWMPHQQPRDDGRKNSICASVLKNSESQERATS